MNIVFVGDRCCDHSPSSGYDQICSIFPKSGWLSGRQLAAGHLTWLRPPAPATVSPQIVHVFYGDCSGSGLHTIVREQFPQSIIVSTVHQPVSRLQYDPRGWASLFAVDTVFTVSQAQSRQLAALEVPVPVHALPHGVWTRAFAPPSDGDLDQRPRDTVLIIGNYLRDWTATQRAAELLARAGVKTVILSSAAPDHLHATDPLVCISPRVSESDLARLYHHAAALLLLVTEATASNALLEAMAAGCPVVCPHFPSLVDEYLGDQVDAFAPGNIDMAVARVLHYVKDPTSRSTRSQALRLRAAHFDWARLRPLYAATYKMTLAHTKDVADAQLRTATSCGINRQLLD